MIKKEIMWFGDKCILACDGKCEKAFGINNRPYRKLSKDSDDYEFMSDSEVGVAPDDPGTYEGGCGKTPKSLNKWCARECERSKIFEIGEELSLPDFSIPLKNKQWIIPISITYLA